MKQHLAAVRMLFDWLVTGHVVPANPAHAVRGPKHSVRKGKTAVLDASEMRDLLASIKDGRLQDLRDRALIALMGYTFARVGTAVQMTVGDFYVQNRRCWMRLHEKGGKVTELPCHHNLDDFLHAWIAAAGPMLRSSPPSSMASCCHTQAPLAPSNVFRMVQKRALAAGIGARISPHSFGASEPCRVEAALDKCYVGYELFILLEAGMPTTVEKITIALPYEMVASMRQAIDAGEYATSSEVVRDALRDWNHKRQLQQNGIAELRQLWREARADKSPGLDPEEVFDELERKYQAIADAAGAVR